MRIPFPWLFLAVLTLAPSLLQAGKVVDPYYFSPDLKIAFPPKLAGMPFEVTTDYEKQQAGLGVGISYRAPTMKADIYIYTDGFPEISTDLASKQVSSHFKAVSNDLYEMERRGLYKDVKVTVSKEIVTIGGYPFLHASFEYIDNNIPRISHLYLGVIKNRFVKIRFTAYASEGENEKTDLRNLLDELSVIFAKIPAEIKQEP